MCGQENKSERIKWNNHEIKKVVNLKYSGSKTVPNRTVKEQITECTKNVQKFYKLIWDLPWKWEIPMKENTCLFIS
jgi:hypothetical protein